MNTNLFYQIEIIVGPTCWILYLFVIGETNPVPGIIVSAINPIHTPDTVSRDQYLTRHYSVGHQSYTHTPHQTQLAETNTVLGIIVSAINPIHTHQTQLAETNTVLGIIVSAVNPIHTHTHTHQNLSKVKEKWQRKLFIFLREKFGH